MLIFGQGCPSLIVLGKRVVLRCQGHWWLFSLMLLFGGISNLFICRGSSSRFLLVRLREALM